MLTHPTLDQMRALKLDGMAEAFIELQGQDAAHSSCSVTPGRFSSRCSAGQSGCGRSALPALTGGG